MPDGGHSKWNDVRARREADRALRRRSAEKMEAAWTWLLLGILLVAIPVVLILAMIRLGEAMVAGK